MAMIGKSIDRIDGRLKVTGAAKYPAEFHVPDVVHAVLVQSTIAAGSITGFELKEARDMPGVLAIITPDNAGKLSHPENVPQAMAGPLLQNNDILFNGQHVAVVVAETLEQAQAAASAVRVTYTRGEAATSMDAMLGQAYVPKHFRNGQRPPDSNRGDPDGTFNSGAVKLDATYITPVEHHNPMEPHATIAAWNGDKLTVWTATQGVGGAQATLAGQFGIDKADVRVLCPYLGAGFGSKGNTWPPATLAALAARFVKRPVKLVLTRAQMYTSNGYRPRTVQKLKLASDVNGSLISVRHDGFTSMSQPVLGEYAEGVALATEMLYACPNLAVTHRLVALNASLPTYMRAPGEAPGVFALESAMDEMAVALKMDPIEFRLHNYAETDPHDNKPFASKALRACYEQGAKAFGWEKRSAEPRSMRDGNTLIGRGFATSTYPTNRQPSAVKVRMDRQGNVVVQCGTQDIGTGTYTVMTQVASDTLGVPTQRIRFELGDSDLPPAPVSGGSQTVASVAPSVQAACQALVDKIKDLALANANAGWQGQSRDTLRISDGLVIGPDRRMPIPALLEHGNHPFIEAEAKTQPGAEKQKFSMHAFGAQFAEVRVDPDLGIIRVSRFVGAFDAGNILNPKTARSQLIGGITYGIGMALLEETLTDAETGRIVNTNVAEYLMPVNADIPDIETIIVVNDDKNSNPLGVKGIGELPMVGVAAAIANAVYHATGVRVRKVPIRIEDVLV
ncbi:MAG: xanthine dehydrogenase, molybdenum binding subunit apoprotein [Rhodopila sp.]|jgi:xanthine dehydrogenase YagR molybdenum-binding subunit|nr:xanthine dehydrogenase, molybdenum binding subunit apoprotein [Rhodopila sp.]